MSIGQDEDTRAFNVTVWAKRWVPQSGEPVQLSMEQMAEMNAYRALRHAFNAGMERGLSKRGCCSENPGANPGCCPDSVGHDG